MIVIHMKLKIYLCLDELMIREEAGFIQHVFVDWK